MAHILPLFHYMPHTGIKPNKVPAESLQIGALYEREDFSLLDRWKLYSLNVDLPLKTEDRVSKRQFDRSLGDWPMPHVLLVFQGDRQSARPLQSSHPNGEWVTGMARMAM